MDRYVKEEKLKNDMKKLMFFAICAMAVVMGCKNKGQTNPAEGMIDSATVAVIDSIIEENDTTPMPMFLIGGDGKYMHMLYWANLEEPQKNNDNAEYFDAWHNSWALQDMFRRNAAQYTNRILGDKITKIKFVDEVLKDPDGNTPSIGEIHGREEIPALCARFDFVNAKDRNPDDPTWGVVICTDSYLNSRKQLAVKGVDVIDTYPSLPADIVKKMEQEYGMKADNSKKLGTIDGRYTHGTIEFKGEYKNGSKDKYDADRKYALALELLIDGDKVYKTEQLGYYDEEYGGTWNADAEGYIPNSIVAAFEGPKGLELCYTHGAPESFCVGMIYLRNEKLVELQYEIFHSLIDEEIPVWKSDLAEMKKLYLAEDPHANKYVELTKWAHCFIDYDNEWIWLRDKDDKNGAFFIRDNGKFKLIDVENAFQHPSRATKDGICYLKFGGSPGGPSYQHIIYAYQNGKQLWKLFVLQVYDDISECSLNGKAISVEEGKALFEKIPEGQEISAYFHDIEPKEN